MAGILHFSFFCPWKLDFYLYRDYVLRPVISNIMLTCQSSSTVLSQDRGEFLQL
jgi:hypothetical protein